MNQATRFRAAPVIAIAGSVLLTAGLAFGCFGTRLRVGVPPDDEGMAVAAYALGYYMEERAGVEPEFVLTTLDPTPDFDAARVDVVLAPVHLPPPASAIVREGGNIPGVGPTRFWVRPDVIDDLRFTLVDRALDRLPALYGSKEYRASLGSGTNPKQTARQAVFRAD